MCSIILEPSFHDHLKYPVYFTFVNRFSVFIYFIFLYYFQLKAEDRGVERAIALVADDRVRIASSDTVEALLENDFRLVINDTEYYVKSPPQVILSKLTHDFAEHIQKTLTGHSESAP